MLLRVKTASELLKEAGAQSQIDKELHTHLSEQRFTIPNPHDFIAKLVEAGNNAVYTVNTLWEEDRERLLSYAIFFERFWVFVENRIDIDKNFNLNEFHDYLDSAEYMSKVAVGEYTRLLFRDGTRALVIRALVGSASVYVAENELIAGLRSSGIKLPKELMEEQSVKNPRKMSMLSRVPTALTALVSEEWPATVLSLSNLYRIFGDPIYYAFGVKQNNLALSVEQLASVFAKFNS
jgi:hypothetical protein